MTEPDPRSAELIDQLRALGYTVSSPPLEPQPRTCSICRDTEPGYRDWWMVDLHLEINRMEEGWSLIDGWICEDCLAPVSESLVTLGLSVHKHSGICFLEDTRCPGYGNRAACPTPADDDD